MIENSFSSPEPFLSDMCWVGRKVILRTDGFFFSSTREKEGLRETARELPALISERGESP